MQKINCIVIDDDPSSLQIMESLIKRTDFLNLIQVSNYPAQVSEFFRQQEIDLVFLDIEMAKTMTNELIRTLATKPEIILISSKKDYEKDAFEYEVTDYLIKPINDYSHYLKAVLKAKENIERRRSADTANQRHLFIKSASVLININMNDILWVSAYGDFVKINTAQKVYTISSRLQSLYEKLPQDKFVRVHRSYIVRLDKIANINYRANNLEIASKIIPISRSFKSQITDRIQVL
jgi:DNA-binding LytR/AlgR family response regulator